MTDVYCERCGEPMICVSTNEPTIIEGVSVYLGGENLYTCPNFKRFLFWSNGHCRFVSNHIYRHSTWNDCCGGGFGDCRRIASTSAHQMREEVTNLLLQGPDCPVKIPKNKIVKINGKIYNIDDVDKSKIPKIMTTDECFDDGKPLFY